MYRLPFEMMNKGNIKKRPKANSALNAGGANEYTCSLHWNHRAHCKDEKNIQCENRYTLLASYTLFFHMANQYAISNSELNEIAVQLNLSLSLSVGIYIQKKNSMKMKLLFGRKQYKSKIFSRRFYSFSSDY